MTVRLLTIVSALLLLVAGYMSAAHAQTVPKERSEISLSFAPVVKTAAPAVVNVYSRRVVRRKGITPFADNPLFRRFFGKNNPFGVPRKRVQNSLGSGVIVDADGTIVTNHHVIRGGTDIRVVLADKREFDAKIVLKDERTDLAVLKIDAEDEVLPYLEFEDSDALEVGDLVLAIGNPFGVGQTVTSGIVSALARTKVGVTDYQFFIQTDAAINPGNSGGALVDVAGRLVGVNTAIFSQSGGSHGIGFAIPANMVRVVVESSRVGSKVLRPWLGAKLQAVTSDIADSLGFDRPKGALVMQLHPKSPLNKAGIKRGDVLLSIDEKTLDSPQEFSYRFATKPVGGEIEVGYLRGGRMRSVDVDLEQPPEDPPANKTLVRGRNPFAGAIVANMSPALANELRLQSFDDGVIIVRVQRGAARRLGFKKGDVILRIGEQEIVSVDDLKAAVRRERGYWDLSIKRGGRVINTGVDG